MQSFMSFDEIQLNQFYEESIMTLTEISVID